MSNDNEIWKPIRNYESLYEISSLGRVRSLDRIISHVHPRKSSTILRRFKPGKILSASKLKTGYLFISLHNGTRAKTCYIHRLVADAFVATIPEGFEVNHKDGNKENNTPDNLEIVTHHENMIHANTALKWQSGERNNQSVLTEDDVRTIRLLAQSQRYCEIAQRYNVDEQTIRDAVLATTWRHVDTDVYIAPEKQLQFGESHSNAKITENDVAEIRRLASINVLPKDIAPMYGITNSTATAIITGKTWRHLNSKHPPVKLAPNAGTKHAFAKLTPESVREIRMLRSEGKTALAIAQSIGVSQGTVRQVIDGVTWKHIS